MDHVLTITVNYKTPELTIKCIESVAREREQNAPGLTMCIVDNDSQDGSVELIRSAVNENGWFDWVSVVAAPRNGGFSYGNNIALRSALEKPASEHPDFFWLLNPDLEIEPGAALELIRFMKEHPKAGMATGTSLNREGEIQSSAYRHFTPLNEFLGTLQLGFLERLFSSSMLVIPLNNEPQQAVWLSGASLMIRREVIDDVGLMDEGYFLYFEETDWCLRAGRAGWELWYVPTSRILHLEGAATGLSMNEVVKPRRPAYWFESRHRFFLKNYGPLKTLLADSGHLLGHMLWRARRRIQKKPDLDPPFYLRDFFSHSVFAKGFSLDR